MSNLKRVVAWILIISAIFSQQYNIEVFAKSDKDNTKEYTLYDSIGYIYYDECDYREKRESMTYLSKIYTEEKKRELGIDEILKLKYKT